MLLPKEVKITLKGKNVCEVQRKHIRLDLKYIINIISNASFYNFRSEFSLCTIYHHYSNINMKILSDVS